MFLSLPLGPHPVILNESGIWADSIGVIRWPVLRFPVFPPFFLVPGSTCRTPASSASSCPRSGLLRDPARPPHPPGARHRVLARGWGPGGLGRQEGSPWWARAPAGSVGGQLGARVPRGPRRNGKAGAPVPRGARTPWCVVPGVPAALSLPQAPPSAAGRPRRCSCPRGGDLGPARGRPAVRTPGFPGGPLLRGGRAPSPGCAFHTCRSACVQTAHCA